MKAKTLFWQRYETYLRSGEIKESKSNRMHVFNTSLFLEDGELNWSQMWRKSLAMMGFFLVLYAIILYFIKDYYGIIGKWVTEELGLVGVGMFTFLVDMLIVPMTIDIIFPFVMGWNPLLLLFVMGLSSAAGGIVGYWIGRLLGHLKLIKRFTSHFSADGERLIQRYGVWAVAIAGFTPIPYSTVCYMAGMVKVDPYLTVLASLSRLPRIALYYALIRGGLSFLF